MWNLFKSFLAFGLATSIEKLIAFLLLPLYTDAFSAAQYGCMDVIQVTIIIITTFSVLQLETSLQRYYYQYKGNLKVVFISTIFNTILACSVLVAVIAVFTYPLYAGWLFKGYQANLPFTIACLQIPFSNIIMLLLLVARFEKASGLFFVAILLKVLLTLGLTYLFLIVYSFGLEGVFAAQFISGVVVTGLLWWKNRDVIKRRFSGRMLRRAWKYAYPQIPARFGSVLSGNVNRYLMVGYLSMAAIGIYSLALKLASVMQLMYTAFILAWTPFIFQQIKKPDHKMIFAGTLSLISCPVFLLVAALSLFAPEILHIVSKAPEYQDAAGLIGGLSLYFSMFIFKEIVDIGPRFKEQTGYISINYFFSLLVNLVLLFLLIKRRGERGVVLSMIVTNIVLLISSWFFSNRLYPIRFKPLRFFVLFVPALCAALFSMYYQYVVQVRIVLFIPLLLFYVGAFVITLKKYRSLIV